ncbi:hypothetical protein H5410_059594 [Solanum commersonii]|uniref:Uncharacterized protein n=1 Tax=Solanum commersonii TaxID=4109 RepID=A0A9J5W3G8_SOLCO|nr:hypothetical protein H5410_059594 [Solanum commersonii]
MAHRSQTYNWYDYKAAWMNFLYLRQRHTWFVKYSSSITTATILRWFYEWWNLFGGIEKILPQQFLNRQSNAKVQEKARSSSKKLSKATLKQKLKEAMDNLDDYDEDQIMKMIEDAASTESSSEDSGDIDVEVVKLSIDFLNDVSGYFKSIRKFWEFFFRKFRNFESWIGFDIMVGRSRSRGWSSTEAGFSIFYLCRDNMKDLVGVIVLFNYSVNVCRCE